MKLNLPNKITLLRICLIPIIVFVYLQNFFENKEIITMILFIIAASTDFIDGNIARSKNMVTTLGKFLDPMADKLLNISLLVLLTVNSIFIEPIMIIATLIIISRELIIGGFRQVAASKNVIIQADKWGKIKAIFQDVLIATILFHQFLSTKSIRPAIMNVSIIANIILLIITVFLTVFSLFNYFIKNKKVFE